MTTEALLASLEEAAALPPTMTTGIKKELAIGRKPIPVSPKTPE
jgi:hypothetical protein